MQFPQREAVLLKCCQMGLYLKSCLSPPQNHDPGGTNSEGKVPQETNPSLGMLCRKLAWERTDLKVLLLSISLCTLRFGFVSFVTTDKRCTKLPIFRIY